MNGDYKGSIPLYKSVLEQEKLLTKIYWYVLIDNLGMAYGITGDLKSAEQLFKYGLSKDAAYPMFYFSLACASAEKNDMKSCINYLKTANKYKMNMLPGEEFPDPAKDDSFQRFMNNDEFLSALKELKKQSSAIKNEISFIYPKKKGISLIMNTYLFKEFKKEWRGEDYYYLSEGKDGFVCSVLFFKLNESEFNDLLAIQKGSGVSKTSPIYASTHFLSSSKTKQYESNNKSWGDPNSTFMYSQVDIKEFSGQKINQKNISAYAMFGEDIYLKVHLSKTLCTQQDSITMMDIFESLKIIY
ncbi:MAG: hypothetical protein NTY07_00970 [Bacteroidia bacterium]|nr:hypothetical protein [Bacteroidia bacterium]